jgi:hypothetical protein
MATFGLWCLNDNNLTELTSSGLEAKVSCREHGEERLLVPDEFFFESTGSVPVPVCARYCLLASMDGVLLPSISRR